MNCLKRLSFALAFCFAASIPVWGQAPIAQVIYVANGGPQIYAVSTSKPNNPTVNSLIGKSDIQSTNRFTSLAVGPDNSSGNTSGGHFFLYACDSTNDIVVRLQLSTVSPELTATAVDSPNGSIPAPVCGRVASNGDLYVSSGNAGVYVIPDASTTPAGTSLSAPNLVLTPPAGTSFAAGGIAQKNNGDLLVVDNMATGSILRAPFTGANPALPSSTTPFDALSDYVSGLSRPTDIARISNGDFFVLTKGSDSVRRYNPSDLSNPSVCVSPPTTNGASLASLATSENNLLYVGVANASFTNKQVVQVVNGSDCSTGTSISLKAVVGSPLAVAVPPVTLPGTIAPVVASSETSSGVTTSSFNFGSSVVQTITQGCEPTVTASQASIEYLDNLMTGATPAAGSLGTWDGGKAIPYNGEGGFGIVYTVSSSCEPLEVYNNFLIGSLIDNTYFTNPRIIRCDTGSGCTVIDASGNWPVGGLIQNDLTVGGKVPGFSKFFLANGTIQNDANTFCGFESPLTNTTDQNLAPTFNSGQNLSVKFKLGAAGQQSCKNGPYVTGAIASLSVARVSPTFQPININASGASTTIEPIFNYSPNNQQYQFSLSLDNYASGTYSITVTFLTNDAPAVTTFFTIP